MKQFFFELLNSLDKLAGLKQLEKIQATSDDPKKEINDLLTVLVNVTEQFYYIPDKDKQVIIKQGVMTDPEFISLNARQVYKWLSVHKDKYFKETQHIQEEQTSEPLTGEARLEWLRKWGEVINSSTSPMINNNKYQEIRKVERPIGIKYTPPPTEYVEQRLKHAQELKERWLKDQEEKLRKHLDSNGEQKSL